MAVAIQVENLSKAYQLGEFGTGTLSRDLERWFAKIRGKEDPFLKIGQINDRTSKGSSDIVWSLKDVNFEIEQGDAVGIIGRNGAGKSTLLKLLSRVTSPTIGSIKVKGRIASLLEVGTGFHPELTGKENIYLNGAILGMRKKEITRKFDEIVAFAGVERYIDTPVKRYSSGMYVRLAFAVAAYLESEILIVDEVLAVGDAEFQKKCLGKMGEVSKGEGRTVLFVSHNMSSIRSLCTKSILLKNGNIIDYSYSEEIIRKYLNEKQITPKISGTGEIRLISLNITNKKGSAVDELSTYDEATITLRVICKTLLHDVSFAICFNNLDKIRACSLWTNFKGIRYTLSEGEYELVYNIPSLKLVPGTYEVITFIESKNNVIERIDELKELIITYNSEEYKSFVEPSLTTGTYLEDFTVKLIKTNV